MRLNILILFLILSCKTSEKKQPEPQKAAVQIVTAEEKALKDSLDLEEGFNNTPDILSGAYNTSLYRGNADKLNAEYDDIANTWIYIRRYQMKPGDKVRTANMRKWQSSEFPAMREAISEIFATSLWEENIYVSVSGKQKNILTFVGGTYASNKNIKETMDLLRKSFSKYRFKRIIFKWYDGQTDYTYYDLSPVPDTDEVYPQ